ncbi:hypothetical protein BT93_A1388 [Corymbia citriodora subsp. variegata]|nr:hypothetical protein BT93_A1388 [Corymbia citriodora subsp. variegata]
MLCASAWDIMLIGRDQHPSPSDPSSSSSYLESYSAMGRQGTDPSPTVMNSSIALLQERFRELQRVKQRREERELMRLSLEPDLAAAPIANSDHQARFGLQPGMSSSSSSSTQDYCSLSLGLTAHTNGDMAGSGVAKTNPRMSLWPGDNSLAISGTSKGFKSPDVDTSLHL